MTNNQLHGKRFEDIIKAYCKDHPIPASILSNQRRCFEKLTANPKDVFSVHSKWKP